MTKIELDNQETRQSLKKEIMDEIKHDARRRKIFNCLGCFGLQLLVIAAAVLFVASILAKTGLVEMPLLTSMLYKPFPPSRVVTPLVGSSVSDILIASATRPKVNLNFGTLTISFTEAELTTLAKEGLAGMGDTLPLKLDSVQIVVNPDAVEIFVTSPQPKREVTIAVKILPEIDGGQLKIAIKEMKIGALVVPDGASKMLTSLLEQKIGEALTSSISGIGQLVGIKLERGIARFDIVPHKSVQ